MFTHFINSEKNTKITYGLFRFQIGSTGELRCPVQYSRKKSTSESRVWPAASSMISRVVGRTGRGRFQVSKASLEISPDKYSRLLHVV